MNANGDPDGTEYAAEDRGGMLEGHLSFARWLGVSLPEAGEMLLNGTAVPAIKKRMWQRKGEELRASGFAPCSVCGGPVRPGTMCPCGEIASGSGLLTGVEALAQVRRRYTVPL